MSRSVVASPEGGLALVVGETTAEVFDLASSESRGTLEIPPGARVSWVGPARVIAVIEDAMRAIDVGSDPLVVSGHQFAEPVQLGSTVNGAALVFGSKGASVVTCGASLVVAAFPSRALPTAAGATATQFLVALPGGIEEWDPTTRIPKRRFRLPRVDAIARVGGTDRTIWYSEVAAPSQIDTFSVGSRTIEPTTHDFGEAVVEIAAHPRVEVLACRLVSGRVVLLDLDGKVPIREVATGAESVSLAVTTTVAVLVLRPGEPITTIAIEATPSRPPPKPARTAPIARPGATPAGPAQQLTWRDQLVAWTRRGGVAGLEVKDAIARIGDRLDLVEDLHAAIALAYGAHLCGERGVPAADVAAILRGRWDEALGRGELAAKRALELVDSKVCLVPAVQRALDEHAPITGVVVGEPGPRQLLGPAVVVSTEPLDALARRLIDRAGAILVPHPHVDRRALFDEALAYGATALTYDTDLGLRDPAIIVVGDRASADRLDLPVL